MTNNERNAIKQLNAYKNKKPTDDDCNDEKQELSKYHKVCYKFDKYQDGNNLTLIDSENYNYRLKNKTQFINDNNKYYED